MSFSFLNQRYPLLFLQLMALQDQLAVTQLPHLDKRYCFIYGRLDKQTLAHVASYLKDDDQKTIFWKVTGGDVQDCFEFDHLFEDLRLVLFFEEPLEVMAMACAQLTKQLEFGHYFFADDEALKQFSDTLSYLYILDYYFVNEKKGLHIIAKHLLENLKHSHQWCHLKEAKDLYQGVPLIVMGAGSSLDEQLVFLKDELAHIPKMALGSALAICYEHNIKPTFGVTSCPNHESYQRLLDKIDCELLFAQPRAHAAPLNAFKGKKVILNHTATFGFQELKNLLGTCPVSDHLPEGATTVASLGLMIALYLGFDPIITCGIDLKYFEKSYAGSITTDLCDKRFYPEITAVEQMAQKHPLRIFRLGKEELFNDIKPLSQAKVYEWLKSYDVGQMSDRFSHFKPYECDFSLYLNTLKKSYLASSEFAQEEILSFIDPQEHAKIFSEV